MRRGALAVTLCLAPPASAYEGFWRSGPIAPLPPIAGLNAQKVQLGERLFHDTRLSRDDTVSCATCHAIETGGVDGDKTATGIDGVKGPINTPTVFNSAYNFVQFWNGRADTLEEQAAGPVHNPIEMGSNWDEVVAKLSRDVELMKSFDALYGDGVTGNNIVDAIAEYERTLLTLNSPFDRFLMGDVNAITPEAKRGYDLFQSYGCSACHQGVNVGGNMFQALGIMGDYFSDRGDLTDADLGRHQVTGRDQDRHVFKVPSLRTAAQTAPYFHDGTQETLVDAVKTMAKYQLGREIPDADVKDIIEFLASLAGEYRRFGER
ncbi:MAG: cytochrome-c peroxidase [Alphaproteobacteria bacterium]|nr:cytochrome-c peroxidase [Alphaproteobacteria bacterium]MBF0251832.1 cytochrome-c peroxidase [Alphaproteobacteria bacterium]